MVGRQTAQFLNSHGVRLGLDLKAAKMKGEFRIPGALAMGSGTLTEAGIAFGKESGNRGDAHGHPVNVAFRLCDKAGRWDEDKAELSPPVLFDRRIGRVLEANKAKFDGWHLVSGYRVELKGIEEDWCYGLRQKPKKTKQVNHKK